MIYYAQLQYKQGGLKHDHLGFHVEAVDQSQAEKKIENFTRHNGIDACIIQISEALRQRKSSYAFPNTII